MYEALLTLRLDTSYLLQNLQITDLEKNNKSDERKSTFNLNFAYFYGACVFPTHTHNFSQAPSSSTLTNI